MRAATLGRRKAAGSASPDAVRVARTPAAKSVFRHIMETHDYEAACARASRYAPFDGVLRLSLPQSLLLALRAAAKEAISRHGLHPWLSKEGRPERSSYESLSLTFNPDLRDPGIHDVHQATLGTSVNAENEFFYGKVQRFTGLKNTYFDTYGFRRLTPAAKIGALGKFLSECKLSLVRSRLSVLYGDDPNAIDTEAGWHRDEAVFENLRVNIPLVSHSSYRLQIEHARDEPSRDSATATTHYLKSGYAYTFDTHRPHRVFPIRTCNVMRVHLVLGFAPWFRYDPADDSWRPNRHYGRRHPFDILRERGLHPALRVCAEDG